MSEPALSGACHDRWTVELASVPLTPGAAGRLGSTGSNAANIRLPPHWRVMVAFAEFEFGPPLTQPLMQPSSQPTSTRPSLSTTAPKKSSMLRQFPPPQIGPRWMGSPGVTFCVVQCSPPSNVEVMYRYQTPVNRLGSLLEPPV